jgi:alkaline phosphatase D
VSAHDDLQRELAHRYLLHRRRFLGLLAAGGSALVLGACSSDGDDPDGANGGGGDGPTGDGTPGRVSTVPSAPGIERDPFTLGVASGDPLPTAVILWTRLAPDLADPTGSGGMGPDDVEVLWEVATDEAFDDVVASGIEPAAAQFGHSVHVDAQDLEPDARYWYRFRIGSYTSPVGRTRTAPAEGAAVDQLTLAFASCQLRTAGRWTAYPHLVDDEPDLVLFLGDYIYEYPGGEGELAISLDAEPATLGDYRVLYGDYKRDAGLQAAHAIAPWVVTWDDHEVENNYAADVPEQDADAPGFAERRRAAYQAYWEHQPIRIAPPDDDGMELHRTVRWGSLADLFVLDGRQYRDDQVCGDEIPTSRAACPEIDDEDASMLGAEQEAWLLDGLTASEATWKVLAQQTVMKALVLGDLVLNVDQWDGYPAARRRLLETIRTEELDNVMVLTGDIHAGGAADLRYPDAAAEGEVVAHELVATSISSPGFGDLIGGLDLTPLGLVYANFSDHGYARCTITPQRWTTEFVIVDSIDTPTASASVDATVVVDAGTPGIQRT